MKLGHMFARGGLPDQAAMKFAEIVAKKSNGSIRIEIYPDAYFGDERRNLLLVSNGKLDFAITGGLVISYLGQENAIVNMPFIYSNVDHALAVYNGDLGQKIRAKLIEEHDIKALSWYYVGTRVLTADRPIHNSNELNGLVLRLPPDRVWLAVWQALGANPKTVQFTDLYSALERGRVDAQETPPHFIRMRELYKFQKYLILTNHQPQRQLIFINASKFNLLSQIDQSVVQDAANNAAEWLTGVARHNQFVDMEWLLDRGEMIAVEFSREGVEELIKDVPYKLAGDAGVDIFNQILAIQ